MKVPNQYLTVSIKDTYTVNLYIRVCPYKKYLDNKKTMLQCTHVQQTYKGFTMSDNEKFILGLAYIVGIVTLGLVLIAAYFDVLVK